MIKNKTINKRDIPVLTMLHPVGEIGNNEDKYYNSKGIIHEYYRNIGIRYLIDEHFILFQTRYAVDDDSNLDSPLFNKALCVVFPVFSGTAHNLFPNYGDIHFMDIMEGLIQSGIPQFFPAAERSNLNVYMGRVAFSAFSIGGTLLKRLFSTPLNPKLNKIREVYTYDTIMESGRKKDSYNEFWRNLKTWQGDDTTKLIRLYSAESQTISDILTELKTNLTKYGGGKLIEAKFKNYDNVSVPFPFDNPKTKKRESRLYKFYENAIEIHSTGNSRILVLLPMSIFESYGYGVANPNGISLWEGHPWFLNALMTHSLCNSMF